MQIGFAGSRQAALPAEPRSPSQALHLPAAASQSGVAGVPAQSASALQPQSFVVGLHVGVVPPQSVVAQQPKHDFSPSTDGIRTVLSRILNSAVGLKPASHCSLGRAGPPPGIARQEALS